MLKLLDCTLRDGGYYNAWNFSDELVQDYLLAMQAIKADYIELGLRSLKNKGFKGAYAYTTDSFLQQLTLPNDLNFGVMINAAELLGDLPLEQALSKLFPELSESSPISLVRVACHVHEFAKALPASNWLKERGFIVGFNLMQIADRNQQEIEDLAAKANAWPIDVLYFADSMGSMSPEHTQQIISWLRKHWHGELGIHTHDNTGMALQNTLTALGNGVTWLDATVTGMGRGPGNAKTEYLILELEQYREQACNLIPLMQAIRHHFQPMQIEYGWGTNPYYYLAGKYAIHPTYIQEMLSDARYNEEDILAVIEHLRVEGGKKFSLNTLDVARHFYEGKARGNWNPSERLNNREILLLGAGLGVEQHKAALENYILKHKPLVIALNTQSQIEAELIDIRVACHPVRLLADCETYTRLPQPLITPASMLPDDVMQAFKGKELFDFGLEVQANTFEFHDTHCILPNSLVFSYTLAVATSGQAKRILLAGFDGYDADDPRTVEMQDLINLYNSTLAALPLIAITPTRYHLPSQSIYAL